MFKWLPEPGKVTKQPLKVRFDGVPAGTNEAHHLGQQLRPQISHFLRSKVQNRQLSTGDVFAVRGEYPGLRMSYSYNHGQEILEVKVEAQLLGEMLKAHEDWWQWALIEVEVPDVFHNEAVVGVVMQAWRIIPGPNESGLLFNGATYSIGRGTVDPETPPLYFSDGLDPFMLSYAPLPDSIPSGEPIAEVIIRPGDAQTVSLLVDMRRVPKCQFAIDIRGYLIMGGTFGEVVGSWTREIFTDDIDITITPTGLTVADVGTNFDLLLPYWPFAGSEKTFLYTCPDPAYPAAPFDAHWLNLNSPITAHASSSTILGAITEWHAPVPPMFDTHLGGYPDGPMWTHEENPVYHDPSGLLQEIDSWALFSDPESSPGDPNGQMYVVQHDHWTFPIVEASSSTFIPASNETRLGTFRATGGFGWMPWRYSHGEETISGMESSKWEVETRYPDRIGLFRIGAATLTGYPEDEELPPLLGRVTIDPKLKSISLKSFT